MNRKTENQNLKTNRKWLNAKLRNMTTKNANIKELSVGRKDLYSLPLSAITVEEGFNLRQDFGDIAELAASIKENGLREPLTVRQSGEKVLLVSGHRRFKAFQLLESQGEEIKSIPCLVEAKGTSPEQRIVDMLLHNTGKNFTPLEEARVYEKLNNLGWAQKDIAKKFGKTQGHVSNLLKMLELPKEVQNFISEGKIAANTALQVSRDTAENENVTDKIKEMISNAAEMGKGKATKKHTPRNITPVVEGDEKGNRVVAFIKVDELELFSVLECAFNTYVKAHTIDDERLVKAMNGLQEYMDKLMQMK